MRRMLICVAAAAAFIAAILISPTNAAADSLTGSATLTWLYPNGTTPLAPSQVIAVGSSFSCPNASIALCTDFQAYNVVFSVGPNSLTYPSNDTLGPFTAASFNGFDFSGLTFASGASLSNFILTTNIPGLTASDVSFGPSEIRINLQGLPAFGTFTLAPVSTPEPDALTLLGTGMLGLAGLVRRRTPLSRNSSTLNPQPE